MSLKYLWPVRCKFDDELHGKEDCEDQVHDVKKVSVDLGLIVEAHGKGNCIDKNGPKHSELEVRGSDKCPQPIMITVRHRVFIFVTIKIV